MIMLNMRKELYVITLNIRKELNMTVHIKKTHKATKLKYVLAERLKSRRSNINTVVKRWHKFNIEEVT